MTGTYAHAWLKVASRWQMAKRLRAPGILAGELPERSRQVLEGGEAAYGFGLRLLIVG